MTRLLAVPLILFGVSSLHANGPVRVCIADEARLDRFTAERFEAELEALFEAGGVAVRIERCASAPLVVRLRIEPDATHPEDALGASRISRGRIGGELLVFVRPVRRLLPSDLPSVVGTALARVAAHELTHHLAQQSGHDDSGLMTERFTGARLVADGRSFVPKIKR